MLFSRFTPVILKGPGISEIIEVMYSTDFFADIAPLGESLYKLMLDYHDQKTIPLITVNPQLSWLNTQLAYRMLKADDLEVLDEAKTLLTSLSERIASLGGDLLIEKINIPVTPLNTLIDKVKHTSNESARLFLTAYHLHMVYQLYNNDIDHQQAGFHADLAYQYNSEPDLEFSNNLGYVFIGVGEYNKAEVLLNRSINLSSNMEANTPSCWPALPIYNLGILQVEREQFEKALKNFQTCINLAKDLDTEIRELSFLWLPVVKNGEIILEERISPDLLEVAEKAKEAIEHKLANDNNSFSPFT